MSRVECKRLDSLKAGVKAKYTAYEVAEGVSEYNVIIEATDRSMTFEQQLSSVETALSEFVSGLPASTTIVLKRYFLSDLCNQATSISQSQGCAVSLVAQPPVSGAKVALWAKLQTNIDVEADSQGLIVVKQGDYRHLWCTTASMAASDSRQETEDLLRRYNRAIKQYGCSLEFGCLRTWFFVRDIDANYQGMVEGRNKVFDEVGLTRDNHFIASTGIGSSNTSSAFVSMDAYAVAGLRREQITYLKGANNFNNTAEYGVRFERGTVVDYDDRRHILISGTASIDNRGAIMYPCNVSLQAQRMIENVEALLGEGGGALSDITHIIVYIRDIADYALVDDIFNVRFADVPYVIVLAPVCRPGWLIEMECAGIIQKGKSGRI